MIKGFLLVFSRTFVVKLKKLSREGGLVLRNEQPRQ